MPMPQITAFYAALLGLLTLLLAIRVVRGRWTGRVGLGDGGQADLARRIRVHGNTTETVPMALILLLVLELTGVGATWLHGFGIALLVGRVLHAWGLSRHGGTSFGRMVGTVLTFGAIGTMCVLLLYRWALLQSL
jgi:uncharacterized membrane protein YecN with MAPEG domain